MRASRCVECHIGPGASWFAQSKLSGTRQVLAVTFNTLLAADPVAGAEPAAGARHLRAVPLAREVPRRQDPRVVEYADDEKNTESVTTLQVHVGGGSERLGTAQRHPLAHEPSQRDRVHRHRRQAPGDPVGARQGSHAATSGNRSRRGVTPEALAKGERRRMDCMDCHNRPSHQLAATPERAVDQAIARGDIERTLPFVRREAVRALKATYPTQDAAFSGIASSLTAFYATRPRRRLRIVTRSTEPLPRCSASTGGTCSPTMNVTWGTYANNIGHIDFPGCFRCHDDNHKAKDGNDHQPGLRALSQDG